VELKGFEPKKAMSIAGFHPPRKSAMIGVKQNTNNKKAGGLK
jgi:hypothetical protein